MFTTELQYVVVRYMLNELADEAANVGIVAVTEDPPRIISQFLPDPSIKSRNDVRVKKEIVDRFASFISSLKQTFTKSPSADVSYSEAVFERLREFGGGLVRTNFPRSVLTNDLQAEIDLLFNELVLPIGTSASRRLYAPRDPFSPLRKEAIRALVRVFRESYGRPLSRKTFHRQYEVRGATHKNVIDLAVVRGTKKHLHEHLWPPRPEGAG